MKTITDEMRSDWFTDKDLNWLMDENMPLESEPKIIIADRVNFKRLLSNGFYVAVYSEYLPAANWKHFDSR